MTRGCLSLLVDAWISIDFLRHYRALDAILGHIPYLSGSSGFVGLCRLILVEISSHILILRGFHHISIG